MQLGVWVVSSCTATVSYSCLLGRISNAEMGRVSHRLAKYLLFKAALVGMVVLPEVTLLQWLPWVAFIGQLKMLVSLAKSRLSGLSLTPTAVPSPAARMLLLLQLVLAANGLGFCMLVQQLLERSRALVLLLGLDMAATAAEALRAGCSCLALLLDDALATHSLSQPEKTQQLPMHPYHSLLSWWEQLQGSSRDRFSYSLELYCDLAVQLVTLLHHTSVWLLHGFSFQLLDALLLLDIKAVVGAILLRIRGHRSHQQMLLNLNSSFPDAAVARLEGGESECVICRDRMTAAKQLPCGHVFHIQCLRAWLQQQSSNGSCTCPVCRTPLELPNLSSSSSRHVEVDAVPDAGDRGFWAMHHAQQQWQQQQQGGPAGLTNANSSSGSVFDLSVHGSPESFRGVGSTSTSSSGSAGADRLLRIADRGQQQQQQEEDGEVNWDEGLGLVAGLSVESSDGFEAVLQQALLASLQDQAAAAAGQSSSSTAGSNSKGEDICDVGLHTPPSTRDQQQRRHEEKMVQPACKFSSVSSSSSRHQCCSCSPQQPVTAASAQLHSSSSSIVGSSVATSSNGSNTSSSSSRVLPIPAGGEDTQFDNSHFEFLERLNSDKFQWSDPLTDTDDPSCSNQLRLSAAGRCVSHTCSRVLSAILSPRAMLAATASEPTPSTPAAAEAAAAEFRPAGVRSAGDLYRCSSGSSSRGWQALAPWHSGSAAAPPPAAAAGGGGGGASRGNSNSRHRSSSRLDAYASLTVDVPVDDDQAAAAAAASLCSADNHGVWLSHVSSTAGQHIASPLAAAAAAAYGSATSTAAVSPLGTSNNSSSTNKATSSAAAAAVSAATRAVADYDDRDECYGTAAEYPAAAAALLERLTSPRASNRRRDAGRWGRRHWARQQQQQVAAAARLHS